MGQAKQRGTHEERKAAAIAQAEQYRKEADERLAKRRADVEYMVSRQRSIGGRLISRPAMMAALVGAVLAGQTIIDEER